MKNKKPARIARSPNSLQSTVRGVPRFLLLIDLRVRARFYIKGKKKKKKRKRNTSELN